MAARRGSPGPLANALETKESGDQGSVPNKRIKIEAEVMELVGGSTTDGEEKQQRKTAAAAVAGDGSNALPAAPTTMTRPLPPSTRRRWISKPAARGHRLLNSKLGTVATAQLTFAASFIPPFCRSS